MDRVPQNIETRWPAKVYVTLRFTRLRPLGGRIWVAQFAHMSCEAGFWGLEW